MAASQLQTIAAPACDTAGADHRRLAACAGLSQAALAAPRIGFFPYIRATLNLFLIVDRSHIDALEGGTPGPAAFADRMPCPATAALR